MLISVTRKLCANATQLHLFMSKLIDTLEDIYF